MSAAERQDERAAAPRHHRAIAIAAVLLCAIALVAPVAWQGLGGLARGDAEARRGALDRAIDSWTEAARAYLPGAGYVPAAHQRLLDAADAAAARGELARAERAYAAVSAAIEDTQWVGSPFAAELARAEAGLQKLRRRGAELASDAARGEARKSRAEGGKARAGSTPGAPKERSKDRPAASVPTLSTGSRDAPPDHLAAAPAVATRMATAARERGWATVAFAGLLGAVLAIGLLRRGGALAATTALARRAKLAMLLLAISAAVFSLGVHQV